MGETYNERSYRDPLVSSMFTLSFIIKIQINILGGFQLEFVSISRVINHMACYKFECSHWWIFLYPLKYRGPILRVLQWFDP